MKATIERVSRFGVMIDGNWKSLSKFHNIDLSQVQAGQEVEIELQKDKFITSISVLREPAAVTSSPVDSGNHNGATTVTKPISNAQPVKGFDTKTSARQTAVNAVLGSPWLTESFKTMDLSQGVSESLGVMKRLESYINTGE